MLGIYAISFLTATRSSDRPAGPRPTKAASPRWRRPGWVSSPKDY
ncbi:hypothetical protein [Pseudooceanicola nitratireducens]|nr:hypothetical protein [Pseudooceanicola nitratireducens]